METLPSSQADTPKQHHVEVVVLTTSGAWPTSGFEVVPDHQQIRIALDKAARTLGITSTTGWIATVAGRAVAPDNSYVQNGLTGRVSIDYGPVEGGGGARE